MRLTRRPDNNCITVFLLQLTVMGEPPQCNFREGEVVLLSDGLYEREGVEVCFVPVADG